MSKRIAADLVDGWFDVNCCCSSATLRSIQSARPRAVRTIEPARPKAFHFFHARLAKTEGGYDMQESVEEYRGYVIVVTPVKDCEDFWDYQYRISRPDGSNELRSRSRSAGGHLTPEIACFAGIEVARTEIDNLLALNASQ
jgi:hypothetical protein